MTDLRDHTHPLAPRGPRPASTEARAAAVRAALTQAADLAQAGDHAGARHLCATVVLDAQPIIAAHRELLSVALHALLVAQGFKLLSRFVMAVSGRNVQVILLPDEAGPLLPPRVREEPRRTSYVLDPRWLARLAPDDLHLRHWCAALTAGMPDRPVALAPESALRHLEPV